MSEFVASLTSVFVVLPVALGIAAILAGAFLAALVGSILFGYKVKDVFDESKERALHVTGCHDSDVKGAA